LSSPVTAAIVACEVGLWVVIGLGMVLRYPLRMRAASTVMLMGVPLLDVVLVVATAVDLHRGANVGLIHALAGFYLGFSVAFGPAVVRWADARFAHRFAGAPAPPKPAKQGPERRRHLMREWQRVVLAVTIASATLLAMALLFAEDEQRQTLFWWIGRGWVVVGLWYLFGPLWENSRRDGREDKPAARTK
jgi:hypothetical protein